MYVIILLSSTNLIISLIYITDNDKLYICCKVDLQGNYFEVIFIFT